MVGAGQGFSVHREIPISISLPCGEDGAVARKIWIRSTLRAYLRSTGKEGIEVDFADIALSDGTARISVKDIDVMKDGLHVREFEDKISKMDFEEMKRMYVKDIDVMKDGLHVREFEDKISKMDFEEMKSADLRAIGMLLTNALAPITGSSPANSTGDSNLYLDSGASRHVVFNPALLINLRDVPSGTGPFKTADGALLSVAAYGDIIMEGFKIPDVYLVPELTVNLISVGQLAKNHKVSSCFAGNKCELISGSKRIGGAIRRDDNQYIIRYLEIE